MPMKPHRRRATRSQGYALVEALVAVVVASVGFIGAARMQTLSLKMNTSSELRQKAVLLTYQMTDRIRANRAGFGGGGYNNPSVGSISCMSSGCTPAELAIADMTEWSSDISTQLPSGKGAVCIDSTPNDGTAAAPACDGIGNVLAVKVWWTDGTGATQFNTMVRP
ncbi:MAG: type IV pilus modification protein PilV [Pseudomonadota bacterium]|nr:type IV pilus modification protein PilV [Pseudomonadota bacterium]